ncbi:MAG: GxxExxY protein [Defluviitaleaceae bacterium]|nr:GxxExxY protein [Defluviitaleaceae bacterium]
MNHEKHENHEKILFKDEVYQIQGAIYDVYREMGSGFLRAIYQECMERELILRQIPFVSQKPLELSYKGKPLASRYAPDLICFAKIIVEIKAAKTIGPEHQAQLLNYLKATSMKLGLIVNFGAYPKAQIQRMINT